MPANVRSVITELVKRDPSRPADDILNEVLADLRARPLDEILDMVTPLIADAIVAEVGQAQRLVRSRERAERRQAKVQQAQEAARQAGQPVGQVSQLAVERRRIKLDLWADLRTTTFTVGGETYTWGNAPKDAHLAAATQHERDARQHRRAARDLDATGRATLDELLDAVAA